MSKTFLFSVLCLWNALASLIHHGNGGYQCHSYGNCADQILFCNNSVANCDVLCDDSESCRGLTVYSSSWNTNIKCGNSGACTNTVIYCGNVVSYVNRLNSSGVTLNGFNDTIFNRCRYECSRNDACNDVTLRCMGDVINGCRIVASGDRSVSNSELYCENINGNCKYRCNNNIACQDSNILHCNIHTDQCTCKGNCNNYITTIYANQSEIRTNIPSTIPSQIPTQTPTQIPTKSPTKFPTTTPTSNPSTYPSIFPTNNIETTITNTTIIQNPRNNELNANTVSIRGFGILLVILIFVFITITCIVLMYCLFRLIKSKYLCKDVQEHNEHASSPLSQSEPIQGTTTIIYADEGIAQTHTRMYPTPGDSILFNGTIIKPTLNMNNNNSVNSHQISNDTIIASEVASNQMDIHSITKGNINNIFKFDTPKGRHTTSSQVRNDSIISSYLDKNQKDIIQLTKGNIKPNQWGTKHGSPSIHNT